VAVSGAENVLYPDIEVAVVAPTLDAGMNLTSTASKAWFVFVRLATLLLWIALGLSIVFAAVVITDANLINVSFLYADEWGVTATTASTSLSDSIASGHNRVPAYIQKVLWWLDYNWLDYRGFLPLIAHISSLVLGVLVLVRAMAVARFSGLAIAATTVILMTLWFSIHNISQYGFYRWRAVEASGVFLLMTACMWALARIWEKSETNGIILPYFVIAVIMAWTGLYLHGGMVLLPIVAGMLVCSPLRWIYKSVTILGLVCYIIHFFQVHYSPQHPLEADFSLFDSLIGFSYVLTSIPHIIVEATAGYQAASWASIAITTVALVLTFWLGVRLLFGKSNLNEVLALFFLGYAILIAIGIAYVRVTEFGVDYALGGRYVNYSIYLILGFTIFLLQVLSKKYKAYHVLMFAGGGLSAIGVLTVLSFAVTIGNFQIISNTLIEKATYMIPYTLSKWQLPPARESTPVRVKHAADFRNRLLGHKLNVFSSQEYATYSSADGIKVGMDDVPLCFHQVQMLTRHDTEHGLLVEISMVLGRPWSEAEGTVVFSDLSGQPKGWAIRHRSISRDMADYFKNDEPGMDIRGYFLVESAEETVRAVLVNEKREIVCASIRLTFPQREKDAELPATDVELAFDCRDSQAQSTVFPGMNAFLVSAAGQLVPDVVARAVTINNDGIVNIGSVGGTGVFSVATVNAGASGCITVSADTGQANVPVTLNLCQTEPATGMCLSEPAPSITRVIAADATPAFGVFVTAEGAVPFDPTANRVFVRFRHVSGAIRGATSVAVRTH